MNFQYVTVFLIIFLYNTQILSNELQFSTSPYLLQHADNPVDWHEWSDDIFKEAKEKNKPIFLSIGYATCHWCHVMEKESFENKKIASLLNRNFISIKVDRERLPQLDMKYQKIYETFKGRRGGWPLSLFLTPEGEVFYITTYIPPKKRSYAEGMDTLLPRLTKLYYNKDALTKEISRIKKSTKRKKEVSRERITLNMLTQKFENEFDTIYGGFGRGKKFPEASKLALMLDVAQLGHNNGLREDAFLMFDAMALRGLYDHVDGGFFRYCVDAAWEIPHFEKMLYNQAELISLYTRAYVLSQKPLYKKVVLESVTMAAQRFERDGLFWSASDADSKAEEGRYYTFTMQEISKALQNNPHKEEILSALDMFDNGNFHSKEHLNFFSERRPKGFEKFIQELRKIRKKRSFPFIDKKINTAWNAMMIEALFKASILDKTLQNRAEKSLNALQKRMFIHGELYHQTLMGKLPTQKGLLEDYAYFIAALLSAYEVEYKSKYLDFAAYLLLEAKKKFYRDGLWYMSAAKSVRGDLRDKYYTSAEAKMVQNIIKLSLLKSSFSFESLAQKSLNTFLKELSLKKKVEAPALIRAYLMQKYGIVVLKSSQKNLKRESLAIAKLSYPYLVTKATYYDDYMLCSMRQCFAKAKSFENIAKSVVEYEKYTLGK